MDSNLLLILTLVSTAAIGVILGYFLRWLISLGNRGSMELRIKQMLLEAKDEAARIITQAEEKSGTLGETVRKENKERDEKLQKTEERLVKKEDLLDKRQTDIDRDAEERRLALSALEQTKQESQELVEKRRKQLEQVANLSSDEVRKELVSLMEEDAKEDLLIRLQKIERVNGEVIEEKAREILASTIQRMANSVVSNITTSTVSIPNDEVKGKIIGKEGRNIKTFERISGVEIIIDDTPGNITLSSFDPIRRQIAKVALEHLISDGRIQPVRIEEELLKANEETKKIIKQKGDDAVFECGVYNLDPRLIAVLGRLHFRTSYGQNVLQHSIEMSHIAGMIAEELGVDAATAKTGALLHDIGKAVDHEVAGSHVEIGRRILQKFEVKESVVKAMEAHHGEYPYETVESIIVQTADAISGGRPGARRDTVENYLKRLHDLEAIAGSFEGVEKAYALQAGREIRIFVRPDLVSDYDAHKLARDITLKIEKDLKYPGEIKVTVIRESRAVEFAR